MTNPIDRIGWNRFAGLLGLVVFSIFAVLMVARPDAEWAQVFVAASRDLWAGRDFYGYGPSTLYLYPPFGAVAGLPFAPFPEWAIRLLFYVVNVVCIVVIARVAWTMAGGGALAAPSRATRDEWTIVALTAAASVTYAWNTVLHQQADLLIDALVAAGMIAALGRRSLLAGVLIGLGAAFKGPPVLFGVYFLWRRDWVAGLAVFATAIGVNLLPDLVSHAPEGLWVEVWLKRWVMPATDIDRAMGAWATPGIFNIANQSLAGTLQRLVNTDLVAQGRDLVVVAKTELVATRPLKMVTYAVMAFLGLADAIASVLGDRRRAAMPGADDREARALELATVPLLMLLFSPMSGLAHFPIVAPAAALLAHRAVKRRDPWAAVPLAVAIIIALILNKDLVGGHVYDTVQWAGGATLATLALWFGTTAALLRPAVRPVA